MTDDPDVHEPASVDQAGRERCACGFLWPCPTVRLAPPPAHDDDPVLAELVDIGWTVTARSPFDYEPVFGTVIAVFDRADPDTGELVRTLRLVQWPAGRRRPRFLDIPASTVDWRLAEGPNSAAVRSTVRRLCEHLAKTRGPLTSDELDALTAATHLATTIA